MAATYEPIQTYTLGSAAASIDFTTIASSWTDLRLVLVVRGASGSAIKLQFNGDTGTNYSRTRIYGNGTSAASTASTNQASILWGNGITTAGVWAFHSADIFSYANSTYKTALLTMSEDENGSGLTESEVGMWRSTSAITTIKIAATTGTFDAGTTATLYGIKAA
jgi:hypothetical protein